MRKKHAKFCFKKIEIEFSICSFDLDVATIFHNIKRLYLLSNTYFTILSGINILSLLAKASCILCTR